MTTPAISGKTGTIDGVCGDVKGWEVTINQDTLDATTQCSGGFREFVLGLKGATGSITSTARYSGTSTITLANTAGGVSIDGSVLWHEETISNEVEGIMEYTQGFTFTGAFTVT